MGSDLYRVKVAAKQDRTVTLRVEVVHPDSNYISDNESFALMLLLEGTSGTQGALLSQEMSFQDSLDRGWLELYTRGFIEKVEKKIESGSSEGQTKEEWLKASVTITATDPAWVSHLVVGAEFDSRAFDVAYDFKDCAPIRPGQVDPNAPVPEAFVSAPGALWENSGLPQVVRIAAYSASAYRSPKLRKGTFQAADLKELDGQVVVYQGPYDDSLQVGHLSIQGDSVKFFSASEGGSGSSSSSTFEGSVGLAELIPGKRLGSKLKVSSLLRNLRPELRSAQVEGDSATFRIALPPGNESFGSLTPEQTLTLGFHLLISPLEPKEYGAQKLFAPSPLSWTLEREVLKRFPAENRQISQYINGQMVPAGDTMPDESSLAERMTAGIVAKTEIISGAALAAGDLDALDEAGQRKALSATWPELVVKVTPLHAAYLEHLKNPIQPSPLPQWFNDPAAWEGEVPAPATGPTGFGKSTPPPAAQASTPAASAPTSPGGGSNKVLKIVGIGCGVIVALTLMCLVLGALAGGK